MTRPSAAIWSTASRTGVTLTPIDAGDHRRREPLAGFELATKDPAREPIVDLPLERSQLEVVLVEGAHIRSVVP